MIEVIPELIHLNKLLDRYDAVTMHKGKAFNTDDIVYTVNVKKESEEEKISRTCTSKDLSWILKTLAEKSFND